MRLGGVRRVLTAGMRHSGISRLVADSTWRRERLLILCYHGIARFDEAEWDPQLYVTPAFVRRRLEVLAEERCHVLPLGEALARLGEGTLPSRSVAITFDDGTCDFHDVATPMLASFGWSATVYVTTWHSAHQWPAFGPSTSYLLWRARDHELTAWPEVGLERPTRLCDDAARSGTVARLMLHAERLRLDGAAKDQLNRQLAGRLGVDYDELCRRRQFQVMTPAELREVALAGMQVELHTHRHRTPDDERLFRREIAENRAWIEASTGRRPTHFCYPSGHHFPALLPWLEAEGITSATTCEPGLASRASHWLRLPRFIDTMLQPELSFRSWLWGTGHLLRRR